MRIMIIDPGFEYSTLSVAEGIYKGFEVLGYEIMEYNTLQSFRIISQGLKGNNKKPSMTEFTDLVMAPVIKEIVENRIDVVIMVHGYYMNPYVFNCIRSLGCKTAVVLTDDPMQVDFSKNWSQNYDFVFTNDRNTKFIHGGDRCCYLPMAVNHFVFDSIQKNKQAEDSYCSEILVGGSFYKERIDFLESSEALKETFLNRKTIFVGARKIDFKDERINLLCRDLKISYEEMEKYVHGAICSIDIPKDEYIDGFLGQSNKMKIKASCLSPRIFECGISYTLPITTRDRSDINTLYPENLIPQFTGVEELLDILGSLKYDKDLRKKLHKIYIHTFENHTYINRVKEMEKFMQISPSKKINSLSFVNEKIIDVFVKDWKENFNFFVKKNLYNEGNSIEKLKDKFVDNCAIIISNGPSLEEQTAFIRKDEKDIVMCLNDATNIFGDICNFSIVIHPSEDVFERCYLRTGHKTATKISLLASTISHHKCVEKWHDCCGPVYFFNTGNEDFKKTVTEHTKFPIIESGCTVGFTSMNLAKYMGFKKIKVYGLDCCYLRNKKYAFKPLTLKEVKSQNLIMTENSRGELVLTDSVKVKTRDLILNFIKENPEMKFEFNFGGLVFDKSLENLRNFV